jgi:hypothetical protein
MLDELNFNEIGIETLARGKETHQFEELSSRIVGAANRGSQGTWSRVFGSYI